VVTTYLVASAVIIPVSGWLSEVVGRKRYYMICVALFTIASLLCGFANNLPMLIVFRVFQGLGGGGMAPSEQAIIADTFSPAKRSAAFALYGVAVIVAPTVGPTIGGWITDNYSWHWIFFINAPIGVISLFLVQWLVVEPPVLEKERAERLSNGLKVDWLGFVLVALFLGCLEIVLDKGQEDDWFQSGFIASFAAISAIAFMVFVPWELSRRDPIVDIRLLGQRQFATAFLVMMAVGAVLFGSTQLLPQLLQSIFGYTATISGLALMPGGLAMLLLMPVAGRQSLRQSVSAQIHDGGRHGPDLNRDVALDDAGAGCELWLFRVDAGVAGSLAAVPVRSDHHGGLFRVAAGIHRAGVFADQCRPQSRRQHRGVHRQYRDRAAFPIPPVAAGRIHYSFVGQLPARPRTADRDLCRTRIIAGHRAAPGHRMDRADDIGSIGTAVLHRCVLGLFDVRVADGPPRTDLEARSTLQADGRALGGGALALSG
jgi:MFS family permease